MPSPLTQKRDQFIAREALITAQTSSQSLQTRQLKQADDDVSRQTKDRLVVAQQQDRTTRQAQQAMDTQQLLSAQVRFVNNESQADKVVASQKDAAAYLQMQAQSKILNQQMTLGYA